MSVPVRHVTEFNAFLFQHGIGLIMLERLVSEDNTAVKKESRTSQMALGKSIY